MVTIHVDGVEDIEVSVPEGKLVHISLGHPDKDNEIFALEEAQSQHYPILKDGKDTLSRIHVKQGEYISRKYATLAYAVCIWRE